jgi:hypothetical protein
LHVVVLRDSLPSKIVGNGWPVLAEAGMAPDLGWSPPRCGW